MRSARLLALTCAAALAGVSTCRSPVNPDEGRFTCQSAKDCGPGWECIAQFSGGSFCFKEGRCVTEQCNGLDDNCDGRVDESFPAMGDVCPTGRPGPCGDGRNVCVDAGVVCITQHVPVAETCNGIDDDCQSGVDDTFNFTTDNSNCGGCGRTCGPGAQCSSSACRETNCTDGIDNDDGGAADCADPVCLGSGCGLDGGSNCGAVLVPIDAGAPDDGGPGDAGAVDAGEGDAGAPDAGPPDAGFLLQLTCVPRESPCDNGFDDDLDGLLDCVDPDCAGRACDGGTCMAGSCR